MFLKRQPGETKKSRAKRTENIVKRLPPSERPPMTLLEYARGFSDHPLKRGHIKGAIDWNSGYVEIERIKSDD
jgi:hypothetical protein